MTFKVPKALGGGGGRTFLFSGASMALHRNATTSLMWPSEMTTVCLVVSWTNSSQSAWLPTSKKFGCGRKS